MGDIKELVTPQHQKRYFYVAIIINFQVFSIIEHLKKGYKFRKTSLFSRRLDHHSLGIFLFQLRYIQILKRECNERRRCNVKASNDMFGDPCPGIRKHLYAAWNCNPS